jgi:flavin reductase (DIM6/NTAB) family NADH-FMN oxidoreductase RutF
MPTKVTMHPEPMMFPRPTLLVGANIDGKANFMTVGGGGAANADPPMISVPIRHHRYSLKGILQNLTFSVNMPSSDLVAEADYCGITSGTEVDKVSICKFTVFYGKLLTAPLIDQCPINLECKVVHILNLGSHALVIGQVEGAYVSEDCLTQGKPDVSKMKPLIYNHESSEYLAFGKVIAKAFSIGRQLKTRG